MTNTEEDEAALGEYLRILDANRIDLKRVPNNIRSPSVEDPFDAFAPGPRDIPFR
jgi:hypothetical protein